MIITITGKPCSGKGTISKIFCEKYNFEYLCTGDIFRKFAQDLGYNSVLDLQLNDEVKNIDKLVDDKTVEIGKTRINENIVFDSRLAWHFIPKSFKVFVDVSDNVAGQRLLSANRENEKAKDLNEAIKILQQRWQIENDRYSLLYNTNNLNLKNYDLIINSDNLTPNEIVEKIYTEYQKVMQKA